MDTIYKFNFVKLSFVMMIFLLEIIVSKIRKLDSFDFKELKSSIFMFVLFVSLPIIFSPKIDFIITKIWNVRLIQFPPRTLWVTILAFILVDFAYYWTHRYFHTCSLGWSSHFMHHSPTKYNISVGPRVGITRFYSLSWVGFLPLIYLGFHPGLIQFCYLINFCYQILTHTEVVDKMGFLEKFMVTPSHHRVHHNSDPQFFNMNYGGVFIVFDKIFGTFCPEEKVIKKEYGFKRYMEMNYFQQIFYFWIVIIKSFWYEKNIFKKIFILFRKPNKIKNY